MHIHLTPNIKNVPFFSNTPDDTHCFQAALKMVVKYFWPEEEYSWQDLDRLTAKVEGLWTWPTAGLLWLQARGANIVIIEVFDYRLFVDKGQEYVLNFFGYEAGMAQIKNSCIPQEVRLIETALKKLNIEKKIPTIADITSLLDAGYLVLCNVNSSTLNSTTGYVGHFVVIVGYDATHLVFHDPGLPPLENRKMRFNEFEKAWAYPTKTATNIIGIKK